MGTQVKVQRDGRVIVATLDNPPHGLMTPAMVAELDALSLEADADDGIGAVVLTGAHPERFLAHYDVGALLRARKEAPRSRPGRLARSEGWSAAWSGFRRSARRSRTPPPPGWSTCTPFTPP